MKTTLRRSLTLTLFLLSGAVFAGGVTVEEPYVRAVPPGQTNSAAFMVLKNEGDTNVALYKATSEIADAVELHEHVKDNDMMVMRQVPQINVVANSDTALKPGGYHVMLIGLKAAIKPGDIIDINLEFDDGTSQTIKAEVRKIDMGMMKKKGMKKNSANSG